MNARTAKLINRYARRIGMDGERRRLKRAWARKPWLKRAAIRHDLKRQSISP